MIKTIIKYVLAIAITITTNYISCCFMQMPISLIPYVLFRIKLRNKLVYIISCLTYACAAFLSVIGKDGWFYFAFTPSIFVTLVVFLIDLIGYLIYRFGYLLKK